MCDIIKTCCIIYNGVLKEKREECAGGGLEAITADGLHGRQSNAFTQFTLLRKEMFP